MKVISASIFRSFHQLKAFHIVLAVNSVILFAGFFEEIPNGGIAFPTLAATTRKIRGSRHHAR